MSVIKPIKVRGLTELKTGIAKMEAGAQAKLETVMENTADTVLSEARRRVPTRSGKARASLVVRTTARGAEVVGGGSRAPYYPWLDYGGRVGRKGSVLRPYKKQGRYIYPAVSGNYSEMMEAAETGLVDLAKESGLEVRRGG